MTTQRGPRPFPAVGQWWSLNREEGAIVAMKPGGAGGMGIAVFDGDIPPAHVAIMLQFDAWAHLPGGPRRKAIAPPCTCVTLDGGIMIADGCAMHSGASAVDAPPTPMLRS